LALSEPQANNGNVPIEVARVWIREDDEDMARRPAQANIAMKVRSGNHPARSVSKHTYLLTGSMTSQVLLVSQHAHGLGEYKCHSGRRKYMVIVLAY
jgi:hypothetical protein